MKGGGRGSEGDSGDSSTEASDEERAELAVQALSGQKKVTTDDDNPTGLGARLKCLLFCKCTQAALRVHISLHLCPDAT